MPKLKIYPKIQQDQSKKSKPNFFAFFQQTSLGCEWFQRSIRNGLHQPPSWKRRSFEIADATMHFIIFALWCYASMKNARPKILWWKTTSHQEIPWLKVSALIENILNLGGGTGDIPWRNFSRDCNDSRREPNRILGLVDMKIESVQRNHKIHQHVHQ